MIEIIFKGINWWGNKIYSTRQGTNIVYLEDDGFYSLSNNDDIDSEPYNKFKTDKLKIVDKFN